MNRCSKCNNELIAGARFCNICGTPVPGAPAGPGTSAAPAALKRTISPEVRRVRSPRGSQGASGSPAPDASSPETGTPDKSADSAGSDQPGTMVQATGKEEAPTSPLPDLPAATPAKAPAAESPAQVKPKLSTAASDADSTVPLPPPPNAGASRAPGIIRPIVTSSSLRQNTPVQPGYTPPNPISPLPTLPDTPALANERARQSDNARFPRPVNTPAPGSPAQDTQRPAQISLPAPVPPRQQSQPAFNNNAAVQQNRFSSGAPQTPKPPLHEMPASYPGPASANGNGTNSTAARQELPLFSPESFAYTSKAAQHWRQSWRDLQNAEAGPAEDVSKGQAEVAAPLANRKDSFLRMRAIRAKQKADSGEKSFGFWVTLFLMICLIGGLAAYIVYSYLPNTSVANRISQTAGEPQPSFNVIGTSTQTFTPGQSLRAHGDNFGANDSIQFLLDGAQPVLASTGSPLSVQSNSQGSFDVTIPIGKDWSIGAHVLSATDTRANLSAYLDIQVNPESSPVVGNNTDLTFTLNGQPIDHLSFTAQLGQQQPPAERITFTNISGAPLQWTAAASTDHNLSWLTIVDNDFAGQLDISQPHTMGISVNPAGLGVTSRPYKGQIVFTVNGSTQLTLPVQLTIINATPEMVFSPNPLVAKENADGTCQSGVTLTFINLGTTVITWSASPDLKGNIQFVNDKQRLTEQGILQPSGMDGDTAVVTLRCVGVRAGQQYIVRVYVNNSNTPFIENVQID